MSCVWQYINFLLALGNRYIVGTIQAERGTELSKLESGINIVIRNTILVSLASLTWSQQSCVYACMHIRIQTLLRIITHERLSEALLQWEQEQFSWYGWGSLLYMFFNWDNSCRRPTWPECSVFLLLLYELLTNPPISVQQSSSLSITLHVLIYNIYIISILFLEAPHYC